MPKCLKKLYKILSEPSTNGNLRCGIVELYVRHTPYSIDGVMQQSVLQLATIDAHPTGTGAFTALLPRIETLAQQTGIEWIYVQNVMKEQFREFWLKRGYKRVNLHLEGHDLGVGTAENPSIMSFAKRLDQ